MYRLCRKSIDAVNPLPMLLQITIEQPHSRLIRRLHFAVNLRIVRCTDFSIFIRLDIAEYHDHQILGDRILFLHILVLLQRLSRRFMPAGP